MSCDYKIIIPIFNVIQRTRTNRKLYVFIGNMTDETKKICKKITDKQKINKTETLHLKKMYGDYYKLWLACEKYSVEFVNDKIYLDDTISIVRKKIFYYLSNKQENKFFAENNQELWMVNKDPNKGRYGCKLEVPSKYIMADPLVYMSSMVYLMGFKSQFSMSKV